MGAKSESALLVVNDIPDREGTTRFQHANGLCESFETTVLCGGGVPPRMRDSMGDVRTYSESVWPDLPLLFPLWLFFWIVRVRASVIVVSPHSLYVVISFLGAKLSSSHHVVDFWDDLTLPIASYNDREGTVNRLKERYHRALIAAARRCLARTDLLILSIHPGVVEKYDLSSVPVLELTNGYDPAAVDVNAPAQEGVGEGERTRFVYLGRANAKRGVDTLVRTVADAVPSHHLDIVGPTDASVECTAARYDNVTLHGEQPYRNALCLVAKADVGLCLLDTAVENYRYSYPIKLFEYAALGTAILASDTPAIRSILVDGESAVLVNEQSKSEVRDAVGTLAEDARLRRTLGERAKAEIQQYAWPRILNRYTAAIRDLARDG